MSTPETVLALIRREMKPPRFVVVCGSRYLGASDMNRSLAAHRTRLVVADLPEEAIVVTGGAQGVDRWADGAAKDCGRLRMVMDADWHTHGKRAGILRNRRMLDLCPERVVAIWDGDSRGTKDTIEEARRRGIPVEVHRVPEGNAP